MGNFLDDIKFQTGASLITEKAITNSSGQRIDGGYGAYSDIVTVTMKITNWGETDAAPCVLTDTLWDGLQFVPGSGTVTGDSGVVGNVSCSGSTVTANIGVGATTAAGGTIKGSQSMGTSGTTGKGQSVIVTYKAKITGTPGSTVKNQASVSYNDKGYESYNPGRPDLLFYRRLRDLRRELPRRCGPRYLLHEYAQRRRHRARHLRPYRT